MSPAMKDALRAEGQCKAAISQLQNKASHGDPIAALALYDVAVEATRTLHALWTERTKGTDDLKKRRELLAHLLGGRPIPCLFGDRQHEETSDSQIG